MRVKDVGDFVQSKSKITEKELRVKRSCQCVEEILPDGRIKKSSKGGSGIGLSIVKKIIEEHGGKIWATSREHTGTTMYFVLRKYQEVPSK